MKISILALLVSAVYATARYNIFKGDSWNDWPIFTMNKALALASLLLLVVAVFLKRTAKDPSTVLGMAGVFGFMHVFLSLTILTPAYFEKFFVQNRFTAAAGLSMVLGAAGAAMMSAGKKLRGEHEADGGAGYLAVLSFGIGLHALLQGFAGWFTPSKWPGMLPPITLISFLLGLAAAAIALWPKRPAQPAP